MRPLHHDVSCTSDDCQQEKLRLRQLNAGMTRLVTAVQELSLARDLKTIMAIIRRAARELTGSDGATFVIREGDLCHYVDEDAISPLWKGQKFPLTTCISGWVMLQGKPAVIEDIYLDPRIPIDAYRPTFVRSLAMIPIRPDAPIGAIGNYWAKKHKSSSEEIELLQALANTASVAMENVRIYNELDTRVKKRTTELEAANHHLESFSYAVSHDLSAPLRAIRAYSHMALDSASPQLDVTTKRYLETIHSSGERMATLIEDILRLSQFSKQPLDTTTVNLSALATEIVTRLATESPNRKYQLIVEPHLIAEADHGLTKVALENLLANAWKYTSKSEKAVIEFGATQQNGTPVFYLRDNGAGFDMRYAKKLFEPFHRMHSDEQYRGHGIGLATVQRIVHRHNGKIWADAEPNKGATFYFTLGTTSETTVPRYLQQLAADV